MHQLELKYITPFKPSRDAALNFHVFDDAAPASDPRGLEPVHLLDTASGEIVIEGHRRLACAAQEGTETIAAILYPAGTSIEDIVRTATERYAPTFTGIERIIALYKTLRFAESHAGAIPMPATLTPKPSVPDSLIPIYNSLFERRVSSEFLHRLLDILDLDQADLRSLHTLGLPIEQLIPLIDLFPKERRVLIKLRLTVPFSTAETKKLSQLLLFARAHNRNRVEQWTDDVIARPSEHPNGASLVRALTRLLRPALTGQEQEIASILKRMKLPTAVKITPPENLEGGSFSCYFKFSNSAEFRRFVNLLNDSAGKGYIDQILDTLNKQND